MAKPILGYWKIRGLVSAIRYQLAYSGVEFQDEIYEQADDLSKEDWFSKKFTLGLDFPNIPYFKDGDLAITESLAIHSYIADKWKPELLGSNAQHRAHVSMLSHIVSDLKSSIVPDCYVSGDKDHLMEMAHQKLPPILKYMGDKKYLTGDQPCWVDFYFFERI